jgi:hypothetical protein
MDIIEKVILFLQFFGAMIFALFEIATVLVGFLGLSTTVFMLVLAGVSGVFPIIGVLEIYKIILIFLIVAFMGITGVVVAIDTRESIKKKLEDHRFFK